MQFFCFWFAVVVGVLAGIVACQVVVDVMLSVVESVVALNRIIRSNRRTYGR